jgi:hypothetical protein
MASPVLRSGPAVDSRLVLEHPDSAFQPVLAWTRCVCTTTAHQAKLGQIIPFDATRSERVLSEARQARAQRPRQPRGPTVKR